MTDQAPYQPQNFNIGYVNPWTDERIAELRELNAQGLSNSKIAAAMNLTRNAVIGKKGRLGITHTHNIHGGGARWPRAPRPKRTTPFRRYVEKVETHFSPAEPPEMGVLDIMQLEPHHCRFPVDGAGLFFYCGVPHNNSARPYCPFHHGIMYQPEPVSKARDLGRYVKWLGEA